MIRPVTGYLSVFSSLNVVLLTIHKFSLLHKKLFDSVLFNVVLKVRNGQLPSYEEFVALLVKVLAASQWYMRQRKV